jgi:outer membrane biosynthesis protein TonB
MKLLETPEEKKSFGITTAVFVVLFILFAFFGLTYMDPPPENGIAVNFGTSDTGSGDIQPTDPPKTTEAEAQSEPEESEEQTLTQDADAPVTLPKTEKKKPVTKPTETKPTETPKKKVNSALDKIKNAKKAEGNGDTSHGDDKDGAGDKGNPNGSLYANSFYGDGSGIGTGSGSYGLKGRGKSISSKKFIQECGEKNIYGKVIVRIEVDKSGKVVKAEAGVKGTGDTSACLLEAAKKTAFSYKWKPDNNAPDRQIGFIEINFTPPLSIENAKK